MWRWIQVIPPGACKYMLEDTAPRVVLTQARLEGGLPPSDAEVIALDERWSELAGQPADDP